MTENFIFPIEPSPDDSRDHIYEHNNTIRTRSVRSPNKLDLTKFLNYPRNQGSRGTCAAFASACIKEYHEKLDCNYQGYFSPDSVYFYRSTKPNEGMYLRDAMKILHKHGIAYETDFPYSQTEPEEVPEKALETAPDYKIKEYAQITTINGLKDSLLKNGPCIIAFPVYDNRPEFWRVKDDPKRNGGHAVAVVGYNDKGFILRNSWGPFWNKNGTVIYRYEEWGAHWEIWTAVDADSPHIFPNETLLDKIKKLNFCCK